jgi:hypothetical protein
MQTLPSTAFGEALDAIRAEDWRGGTPTLAVVGGVFTNIDAYRADHPGHYALVLVTDGYPQNCKDDSIESVEDAVRARAADIPTYVIGVKNPPLTDADGNMAPDTVSNLAGVAEAGGTGAAFIIDTGDPTKTTASFQAAVDQIRGVAIACNLDVPKPPDGRAFQKDHVQVSYTSDGKETTLAYDADCTSTAGWHYDDLTAPALGRVVRPRVLGRRPARAGRPHASASPPRRRGGIGATSAAPLGRVEPHRSTRHSFRTLVRAIPRAEPDARSRSASRTSRSRLSSGRDGTCPSARLASVSP